ncbi:MAG: helix-turn-helix transcriptional regulator [Sphingomonas sp.]|uniref:PadR family transcriptional regulator n=1 Tax=Sphingomonas sp. TaxID=28214 RepID=UPI001AC31C67|nr:helix-turn-helix transcriptional regulator [Sphingomonas sp.]MBN8808596.1 helix-turn-helix transcriptional regulator [Sphingomonas sp.]
MAKQRLTELEGAVLTEVGHRGNDTSFKVRRAFERSPSSSWSGSAGAVYPAIARLVAAGLIATVPGETRRGTRLLSLTAEGRAALEAWFTDPLAACSIGADPFRLRAGLWETLPGARRREVIAAMIAAVRAEMAKLEGRDDLDPVERIGNDLARMQQEMRLAWLERAGG